MSTAYLYSCLSYIYLSMKMKGSAFKLEKSSYCECFRPYKLITNT